MINKINYEQFAMDYLEGNLSGTLLLEMEDFLNHNLDIKEELAEMELFYLEADENILFEGKDALIQPVEKEKGFFTRPLFWISGIAAFFILTLGLFLINSNINNSKNTIAHDKEIIINQSKNDITDTNNHIDLTENKKETNSNDELIINKETIKNNEAIIDKTINNNSIQKKEIIKSKTIINEFNNNNNNDRPIAYSKPESIIHPKPNNQSTEPVIHTEPKKDNTKPIAAQEIPVIKNNISEQKDNIELKPLKFEAIAFNNEEIILDNNNLTVIEPKERFKLMRMGLLPENSDRKISLRSIKDAFIPEDFASRD